MQETGKGELGTLDSGVVVRVHIAPGARLPEKATEGAAAWDVRAQLPIDQEIALAPMARFAVPTGLTFEIPPGYFISVRPRSGLALRDGILLPNTPGTIDSDYRGEFKVIMMNLGEKPFIIRSGDRIAQILVEREVPVEWTRVEQLEDLDPSARGRGGFGSTGLA